MASAHQKVADHYEKFPYPQYPWYATGSWKALDSVDTERWGATRPIEDIWIAGCGTISPVMFARRNFKKKILATDISKRSLHIAGNRLRLLGQHNVMLLLQDVASSPYESAFDAIDCFGVLHHTDNPAQNLKRLESALRPGGILRLMVYSKKIRGVIEALRAQVVEKKLETPREILSFLRSASIPLQGDLSNQIGIADALMHPLVHVYDEDEIETLLRDCTGFKMIAKTDSANFVLFLRRQGY